MSTIRKRQSMFDRRPIDGYDTVLLSENPDPAGDGSLPQRPTAQGEMTDLGLFMGQVVTADATAEKGMLVPVDTTAGDVTIWAPPGSGLGVTFGVLKMTSDANKVIVNGSGFDVQKLYSWSVAPTVDIVTQGGVFAWTLSDPDDTGARWMVAATTNDASVAQSYWSPTLVTPADSPYQISNGERVRYDSRTVTDESQLVLISPAVNQAGEMRFAIKEVFGSDAVIRLQSGTTVSIENPRVIPATADPTLSMGGSGEYVEWTLSDNRDVWLITNRFQREVAHAHAVFSGTTTNGDLPAGNIRSEFGVMKVTRTGAGVYDIFFDVDVATGTVLACNATVFSQNLPANTTGSGSHIGTTFGAKGTAKVTVEYGTRNKNGQWTNSDFATAPDHMIVQVMGLAP